MSTRAPRPPRPAPPAGHKVKTSLRLPAEVLREIEAFRVATHRNKEGAYLVLLLAGLQVCTSGVPAAPESEVSQ